MNVSSRTLKYGLLTAAACVALGSCSKLFSPCGSGEIPDTDQTETLLKAHVFHLAPATLKKPWRTWAMPSRARP